MSQDSDNLQIEEPAYSQKPVTAAFECLWCCEEKPTSEFTKIEPCNHRVCTVCITHYCTNKFEENNNHDELWPCTWGDGWFKPIIDEYALKKDLKPLSFWENIMLKLTVPKKDRETAMMARAKRWSRCPRCRYYVHKINGCSYMICRCGKRFCYDCGRSSRMCFCNSVIINAWFRMVGFSGRKKGNSTRWQ